VFKNKKNALVILFAASMACLASLSQAAAPSSGKPAPDLSLAASTCAVDESSLNLAELDGATLTFRQGAAPSSEIVARCGLADTGANWKILSVAYDAPPGTGINVDLVHVDPANGEREVIAAFDSGQGTEPVATAPGKGETPLAHPLKRDGGVYFFEAHLYNGAEAGQPAPVLSSVGLASTAASASDQQTTATTGSQTAAAVSAARISCPTGQCAHGVKISGQCTYYCGTCPATSCN